MKKFKLVLSLAALVLCVSSSVNAQDAKTDRVPKEVSENKAKASSMEMVNALGIKDQSKIQTIGTILSNYELTLQKSIDNPELSAEQLAVEKGKIEQNRDKRLQGILDQGEFKKYQVWKQAEAAKMTEEAPKSSGKKKAPKAEKKAAGAQKK